MGGDFSLFTAKWVHMQASPALKAGALILLFLAVCICGCTQSSTGGGDDTGDAIDQQIQALSSGDKDTELAAITLLTQVGEPAVQPIIDSFTTGDNKTPDIRCLHSSGDRHPVDSTACCRPGFR